MSEEGNDPGFKVEDKRRFTSGGDPVSSDEAAAEQTTQPEPEQESPVTEDPRLAADPDPGSAGVAELTFSGFVIGLASQAFMFLGVAPDPVSGVIRKDIGEAKALIDILGMLREKTVGNLSDDEDRMMEEMLYELRMQYVRETRGETGGPGEGRG